MPKLRTAIKRAARSLLPWHESDIRLRPASQSAGGDDPIVVELPPGGRPGSFWRVSFEAEDTTGQPLRPRLRFDHGGDAGRSSVVVLDKHLLPICDYLVRLPHPADSLSIDLDPVPDGYSLRDLRISRLPALTRLMAAIAIALGQRTESTAQSGTRARTLLLDESGRFSAREPATRDWPSPDEAAGSPTDDLPAEDRAAEASPDPPDPSGGRIRHREGPTPVPVSTGRNRLCLFVHFDPQDTVDDYVLQSMAAIKAAGFRVICITMTRELDRPSAARLAAECEQVLYRKNTGHDFGAWSDAFFLLDRPERWDELLLANDSFYGPLFPLANLLDEMSDRPCDFWGITDSWAKRYHLQSYFLVLRKPVLASAEFRSVMERARSFETRDEAIDGGEIALTQDLLAAGYRSAVYCPYSEIAREAVPYCLDRRAEALARQAQDGGATLELDPTQGQQDLEFWNRVLDNLSSDTPMNPTHFFWRILIERFSCPALKTVLLRENPEGLPDLHQWRQVVASSSRYEPRLIERHLMRAAADGAV